jgi:hypothetical protein
MAAIRYLANAYVCGMGAYLTTTALLNLAQHGGQFAFKPSDPMSPGEITCFVLWLACATFAGWRGMDHEASK